jgi:two-component system LytT family response regulator
MKSANPTSKPIRVVIIDDEPPARRKLHEWLQRDTAVEIVGECGNGFDALRVITEVPPEMPVDVMFLDIQMPEMSGIELLRHLSEALPRLPLVIFVTAFDRYAIEAFNLHALDYLLKPYDEDRFQRALDRAKSALEGANSGKIQQENL